MLKHWIKRRFGPIGVDVGARSVKLVQFTADRRQLVDVSRRDLFRNEDPDSVDALQRRQRVIEALRQARDGRDFRGREAVVCLSDQQLFLQNLRVPKVEGQSLERLVRQEAASRMPFPLPDAEIRYLEAADIRQGDTLMREVILLACHRPQLEQTLEQFLEAGIRPMAVDVEPAAIMRSYARQFRRDQERSQRTICVHVGYASTAVIIAQGEDMLFVKYVDLGGKQMNEAVARLLDMDLDKSRALRRQLATSQGEHSDPEVARTVAEATRPVMERLAHELSMCLRYHSVTFRGKPLQRLLLGGGEASESLLEALRRRLNLKCELSDPFRRYPTARTDAVRRGQWDIAAGLALRPMMS